MTALRAKCYKESVVVAIVFGILSPLTVRIEKLGRAVNALRSDLIFKF